MREVSSDDPWTPGLFPLLLEVVRESEGFGLRVTG